MKGVTFSARAGDPDPRDPFFPAGSDPLDRLAPEEREALRAPIPRVPRIPGHCKGCKVELPKGSTAGRPREWCETCMPPHCAKRRRQYQKELASRAAPNAGAPA
jgi:hypothetical protein